MRISIILIALFPLFMEYTIAGKVYTVHNYRRIVVNRNTATVRQLGNTYIFPRYRASSKTSVRRCSYGGYSRECCAGWSRNRDGSCSPICTNNCVHGTCVGPDMCKCNKGYTGKSCNQDLNECGTEPRPCDHRCVNTQGSFRCYCEKGYVLLVDKQTCVRDRRCYPGRCSYACAFNKNEVTCVCPPGLRLIEDGYHCKDIDECAEGLVICPIYQECKNTFGNFLCLCIEGFEFQYIDGEYQCVYSPIDPEIENPESIHEILRSPIDPDILNPERIYATLPGAECSAVGYFCSTGSGSCVSTSSGPRCKCIEGYHGDGEVCVLISTRTCGDQPCFPGVECKSASLPKSNDVEQLLTLDIIIPYECGACPVGYVGPGETCYDINECERGPLITGCHFHAFCENIPGDFICICSDGFFGNGTHCSILDIDECETGPPIINCNANADCESIQGGYMCMCSDGFFFRNETYCRRIALVTCDQQPCFPGVECDEVSLPDPYDVDFFLSLDIIVLYQCGPCPPGYVGDGEMCEGGISEPFVNLTVLVLAAEPSDGDPILSSAFVRTFVSDPTSESGTREHRRARTADNGMAVLECPHNKSIIVTANDADYFANSVTFRCNINQTNAVTLHLHKPYEDTTYVYHPESPREFGVGNETLNERYSIYFPQDSFNISDNQRVRLLFRSVNVSVTSELELAPEMIACIPNPTGTDVDIRAIETFGAVELTVIDLERRRAPPFKDDKEMVLTFPIQKLPADLSVGDKVPAWTFKFGSGCWEEDGEGELVIDEATGNLVWRYEANHFSWWAAGRVNPRTSCVTVRTCYDKDCSRPAPDTLIRIFGKDYGFETFRYTDTKGQMCVQFPYGRTVELSSPCTSGGIEVASTENPSSCDGGRFEIPKAPDYQMEETQDSCREAVLVIPEYEKSCPQPEKVHNNLALDKNMIRDAYPYTDVVHYSCSNPDYEITTHGYGNRVCTRCFSWTGILMCEPQEDEEFSY